MQLFCRPGSYTIGISQFAVHEALSRQRRRARELPFVGARRERYR
ncbi:MAG: hypothetical protein ACLU48_02485 [Clostridiaceae bacterium]